MADRDLYGGSDISYADNYNIGRLGEFERFRDERAVASEQKIIDEMLERPQLEIGGYNEQGYTLPASEPDSWLRGYSKPGDVVEQQRGIYPFLKRHSPEWAKDIYRGGKGAWEGSSGQQSKIDWLKNLNPFGWGDKLREENEQLEKELEDINIQIDEARMHPLYPPPGPWNEFDPVSSEKEYIENMFDELPSTIDDYEGEGVPWDPSEEYLRGETNVSQSKWREPENVETQINILEILPEFEGWTRDEIKAHIFRSTKQANRGGIMSLNSGGSPHLDRPGKIPLDDEMKDQMYDWILEQIWRQKEHEQMEEDMRMPYVAPDAILEA